MSHKRVLPSTSAEHVSDSESDDNANYDDATNDSDINGDTSEEELFTDNEDDDSDTYSEENGNSSEEEEEGGSDGVHSWGAWCSILGDDRVPHPVPFIGVPGPRRMPDPASQPIEYLNLFLTNKFIDDIVKETNAYAKEFIENNGEYLARHVRSRIHTS